MTINNTHDATMYLWGFYAAEFQNMPRDEFRNIDDSIRGDDYSWDEWITEYIDDRRSAGWDDEMIPLGLSEDSDMDRVSELFTDAFNDDADDMIVNACLHVVQFRNKNNV